MRTGRFPGVPPVDVGDLVICHYPNGDQVGFGLVVDRIFSRPSLTIGSWAVASLTGNGKIVNDADLTYDDEVVRLSRK